jgi:hypothetical protein
MEILEDTKLDPVQLLSRFQREPFEAFKAGVWAGFVRWPAMALCIQHGWADRGEQKRQNLYEHVIGMFQQKMDGKVNQEKLADLFSERLSSEFNTDIEDDSEVWLARLCLQLWQDCMVKKDFTGMIGMIMKTPNVIAQREDESSEEDDEDDSEGEDDGLDNKETHLPDINTLSFAEEAAGKAGGEESANESVIPNLTPTHTDDEKGVEKVHKEEEAELSDGWTQVTHKKKKHGGGKR